MVVYKNIFLADDDPEDREVFMEVLSAIDGSIECVTANDGEKALQILCNDILQRPELIFLDMNMPFLTGKQVLGKIKLSPELKDIPVIMYSTFFNEQDLVELREMGAVHNLIKPTSFEVLIASLTAILQTKW